MMNNMENKTESIIIPESTQCITKTSECSLSVLKPDRETLVELCKTMKQKDIATKFGVSSKNISDWIRSYGLNYYNIKNPSKDELIELCKTMTQKEIAKQLGVHETTIYRWLRSYDLTKATQ